MHLTTLGANFPLLTCTYAKRKILSEYRSQQNYMTKLLQELESSEEWRLVHQITGIEIASAQKSQRWHKLALEII